MLKLPPQGYWLTLFGWLIADYLFISVRFVGLSSVPVFAGFDYAAIDHGTLFAKGLLLSFVFGTVTYLVGRVTDVPAVRRRPYSLRVAIQVFTSAVVVTLYLAGLKAAEILGSGRAFTLGEFQSRLLTVNFLVLLAYYSLVSFIISFVAQINRILGPGNLRRLITGEFHQLREVELVLMFLDLKDSTTHAERIGQSTWMA